MIEAVRIQDKRPDAIAGDKGYSSGAIRRWLAKRDIQDVNPTRKDEKKRAFNKRKYRERNVVERCIGWPKECRRIATRYENLAVMYLAMLKLAIVRGYLKYDLSNTT